MAFALGPRATSAGYRLAVFDQVGSTNTEAMAHARVVIGGDVGGIPEMVTAEETGVLVRTGTAVGVGASPPHADRAGPAAGC